MNNQKNRRLPTRRLSADRLPANRLPADRTGLLTGLLTGLVIIPCLLVGSATPLPATEPTTHSAAIEDSTTAEHTCEFFSSPQRYNTQRIGADGREIENSESTGAGTGTTIVIGPQPNRPYQVIIPGDDAAELHILRACILDAFISRARFGPYIHTGSFGSRREAEGLKRILTREGYPARVIYRR